MLPTKIKQGPGAQRVHQEDKEIIPQKENQPGD